MASLVFSPSRLRAARDAAELPRDKAAVFAGLSSAALENWELGRSKPDAARLASLCEVLGIDMGSLFVPTSLDGIPA